MAGGVAGGAAGGGSSQEDAGCALEVDPAATQCPRDVFYLSPTGSDQADGRSPSTARRTIGAAQGLTAGDEVRLAAGTWSPAPTLAQLPGERDCPMLVSGDPDGGTVIAATFALETSHTVFRSLQFAVPDQDAVRLTANVSRVVFDQCRFSSPNATSGSFPWELQLTLGRTCTDCSVRRSRFESGTSVGFVAVDGPRFEFRGNQVRFSRGDGISIGGADARVEGNDFSGTYNRDNYLRFAGTARVAFNVFHDIASEFPDKPMVWGLALRVTRNTFVRISGNGHGEPLIVPQRFDSNLVSELADVVGAPSPAAGDFNVFDPTVERPYTDGGVQGTDRIASVDFDPGTFVPRAGSVAIDSADPALPVPPGGGARADVGAFERGASRLADGRYCQLDGGT